MRLVRPEIRLGTAWSPFPEGWQPGVSPEPRRPFVDVVQAHASAVRSGRAPEGPCYWIDLSRNDFLLGWVLSIENELVQVDLADLYESYPVTSPLDPDLWDFQQGYDIGVFAGQATKDVGDRARSGMPSWFDRGLMKGFEDQKRGVLRHMGHTPFNETYRFLSDKYPEEWRLGTLDKQLCGMYSRGTCRLLPLSQRVTRRCSA